MIEKYVSFQVDTGKLISVSDQRKITKYFREYKRLTVNPVKVYKGKTASNVKFVQKSTGLPKGFGAFKVAFVPVSEEGAKVKIRITKGKKGKRKLVVSDMHISRKVFLFSDYEKEEFQTLVEPKPVVDLILRDSRAIDEFTLMCGKHETKAAFSSELLEEQVERFVERYDNAAEWFFGVIGYSFKNQEDIASYRAARNKAKRKRAKRKDER